MRTRYQQSLGRVTLSAVINLETVPSDTWPALLADRIVSLAQDAVSARGRFVLNLSGGSTPRALYQALRSSPMPWGHTVVVWGDERNVDPDDKDRNERMARESLLDHVGVPEDQVWPWPYVQDAEPTDLADTYAHQLQRVLGSDPEGTPWFDLTLLGLGADAHTAGLFPTTDAAESEEIAVAAVPPGEPYARLSLTIRALCSSRHVWLLAFGAQKREALARTIEGGGSRRETPAAHIHAWNAYTAFTTASG